MWTPLNHYYIGSNNGVLLLFVCDVENHLMANVGLQWTAMPGLEVHAMLGRTGPESNVG
ncbi:MAG: hypothetical protein JWM77_816 [Rhodospirillales bacterium]|nr:hypothetical protein [Rhodospirillales bacterium]